MPPAGQRAWAAFWLLDITRNGNGWAADRITHRDIAALVTLRRLPLGEWEQDAIISMDAIRCDGFNADGKSGEEAPKLSARSLSPALFDALTGNVGKKL